MAPTAPLLLPLLFLAAGCGGGAAGAQGARDDLGAMLFLDQLPRGMAERRGLITRIRTSPHAYFRFINERFASAVCRAYRDEIPAMPLVNLQGDAHVEQFVVTSEQTGLSDYDDATAGPPVIDLVRFKTSLILAARQRGWAAQLPALLRRFDQGYRDGLTDPEQPFRPGSFAERMRAAVPARNADPAQAWMSMTSGPPIAPAQADAALASFVTEMRQRHPDLSRDFFRVKQAGHLEMGIGSGMGAKLLFRIEGSGPGDQDDVVLEAKEVSDISQVPCIAHHQSRDGLRVLVGQARISFLAWKYTGFITWPGEGERVLWVHEWDPAYAEASIGASLESASDLGDLAQDVGFQLGRGHPNLIAAPLDRALRQRLLVLAGGLQASTDSLAATLASATTRAWLDFRKRTE